MTYNVFSGTLNPTQSQSLVNPTVVVAARKCMQAVKLCSYNFF